MIEDEPDDEAPVTTVWMPPGVFGDPPPDKRRWNAVLPDGVKPWTVVFLNGIEHPGEWQLLCATQRPEGVCHRIRTGKYGACKDREWLAVQRSIGGGWASVWCLCVDPAAPSSDGPPEPVRRDRYWRESRL